MYKWSTLKEKNINIQVAIFQQRKKNLKCEQTINFGSNAFKQAYTGHRNPFKLYCNNRGRTNLENFTYVIQYPPKYMV